MPSKPAFARTLITAGALTATVLCGVAIQASAQTPVARASGGWLVDTARTGDTRAAAVFIAHGADVNTGRDHDGTP